MKVLVTGGIGYIGSHTCVELINAGMDVVVVDNLYNSCEEAAKRVEQITGKELKLYKEDILNHDALDAIFDREKVDAVIHFAGYKAVGESVAKPLEYYYNNVTGTLVLCDVMRKHGVKNLVFSSSATVYGKPETVPIKEDFPLSVTNPYGRTKLMIEDILRDLYVSDDSWNIILLRYFNPIGAHKSGLIGENPRGIPNNLMPYITQVAVGKLDCLGVFGDDYDTHDGTGVRDYIHVVDLAVGHVKAIQKIAKVEDARRSDINYRPQVMVYNLGTGKGYSVLDMVKSFEKASGKKINYQIKERRPGDIDTCYADPSKAKEELGWEALRGIDEMCADSWNWQKNNPEGYEE